VLTNIFSHFDTFYSFPQSYIFYILLFPLFLLNNKIKSKKLLIISKIKTFISNINSNLSQNSINIIINFFIFFYIYNNLSLFPWTFTPTAQTSSNISFIIIIWLLFLSLNLSKNNTYLIIHFIPKQTPTPLIIFLTLIEIIRKILRPITLILRITANITTGHILLNFFTNINFSPSWKILLFSLSPTIPALLIIELLVSFIQAFILLILNIIYISE